MDEFNIQTQKLAEDFSNTKRYTDVGAKEATITK